jgi:hypothetical protein
MFTGQNITNTVMSVGGRKFLQNIDKNDDHKNLQLGQTNTKTLKYRKKIKSTYRPVYMQRGDIQDQARTSTPVDSS